ncbi:MAG: hypothetical protein IJV64_01335, partial [Oscillospiraceae bacterium]|nr:hypothetical protein [Oscillospiraceae bacterium]
MDALLSNPLIKDAIEEIAIRTELHDPKTILNSFYDCDIIPHLRNRNHQIIQGRRGTGKTHILRVLERNMESDEQHCIFFDCKEIGSAGEIANSQLPERHRVIQLMRDFLLSLHSNLMTYFEDIISCYSNNAQENDISYEVRNLLEHLYSECFTVGKIEDKFEDTKDKKGKISREKNKTGKISKNPEFSIAYEYTNSKQEENEVGMQHSVTGMSYGKIIFPNISQCLSQLAEITNKKFIILVDEWSTLPLDIQPHFAEFLRCCITACNRISLKIAVVRDRTNYFIR